MRSKLFISLPVLFILLTTACEPSKPVIKDKAAYLKSVEDWKHSRLERLKGKSGWLNLAGLYWLKEGENRFGSDSDNDIVFPEKADPFCGSLILEEGKVTLQVNQGVEILNGNIPVKEMDLQDDHAENPTLLEQGDLAWYIIKRGEDYGVRLRDYKHHRIEKLDHIPSYPVSTGYVVAATLVPFDRPMTMNVATPVEGFTESYQCPGELHFRLHRKDLVLYPFSSEGSYFIVFADETTGVDTYGAGRFMYADPDSTGRAILDFNKAYNPPCAFSPFATCPMPPKENFLPVAIEAGEKAVHLDR
jgi:uncharacterized protein (DUF1684 family)